MPGQDLGGGPAGRRRAVLGALAVAVAGAAALVFLPALFHQFTDRDDPELFLENEGWRPLTWAAVRYAFASTLLGHRVPVTWLSWSLDHALWGLHPFGFHLTNLAGHAASAAVLVLVADRLLGRAGVAGAPRLAGAAGAALFWACHPLRAETVAWVTERRGVLSGLFFLLAILAYLVAVERAGAARRWQLLLSLGAFALAVGAKSAAMTLPAVLLLLDVYPLRRLAPAVPPAVRRAVLLEKAPYVVLAAAGAGLAMTARRDLMSMPASLADRTLDAAYTLWFHLWRQVWPVGLSPLYEWPVRLDWWRPRFLVSVGGCLAVTALAVGARRRWPAITATWAYHVITLAPVLGWVPLGIQLTADRYGHLPSLGWAVLGGGGLAMVMGASARGEIPRKLARGLMATALVGLVALGTLAWRQAAIWRDGRSLWRHAARVDPGCWRCQEAFADWLATDGEVGAARATYRRALDLFPEALRVRRSLGRLEEAAGQLEPAEVAYREALRQAPGSLALANDLLRVLYASGRPGDGVVVARRALEAASPAEVSAFLGALGPDGGTPPVLVMLALGSARLGRQDEAATHVSRLRGLDPSLAGLVSP